jgi:hypothetical protein
MCTAVTFYERHRVPLTTELSSIVDRLRMDRILTEESVAAIFGEKTNVRLQTFVRPRPIQAWLLSRVHERAINEDLLFSCEPAVEQFYLRFTSFSSKERPTMP